jgi:hypothetical protein
MKTASKMLADALMRYSNALIDDRPKVAADEANRLYHHGELVVIHPVFLSEFKKQMPDMSAESTLRAFSKFLVAVADGMHADGGQAAREGSDQQRAAIDDMHGRGA